MRSAKLKRWQRPAHAWAGDLSKDAAKMIKDPQRFLKHLNDTGAGLVAEAIAAWLQAVRK